MKRSLALFGVVAVLLTATVALTVSRATFSAGGVGSLRCYGTGGIEKACSTARRRVCRRSMCNRVQAVSHKTRKRQHQRRCTAKCEKNFAGDAKHRPLVGDLQQITHLTLYSRSATDTARNCSLRQNEAASTNLVS